MRGLGPGTAPVGAGIALGVAVGLMVFVALIMVAVAVTVATTNSAATEDFDRRLRGAVVAFHLVRVLVVTAAAAAGSWVAARGRDTATGHVLLAGVAGPAAAAVLITALSGDYSVVRRLLELAELTFGAVLGAALVVRRRGAVEA